jgi:hypothetical protein
MRLRPSLQASDRNGVVCRQRDYRQLAPEQSSATQVLDDLIRLLADLGELAQDFGQIDGADRRAANQRVFDQVGASFIVEIGEKGRSIEDGGCVLQSAGRRLSPGFGSPVRNQLVDEGSAACPQPVESSCLLNGLTRARQA